jgi:hypothetical protein
MVKVTNPVTKNTDQKNISLKIIINKIIEPSFINLLTTIGWILVVLL